VQDKRGNLGIRFVKLAPLQKRTLQLWLATVFCELIFRDEDNLREIECQRPSPKASIFRFVVLKIAPGHAGQSHAGACSSKQSKKTTIQRGDKILRLRRGGQRPTWRFTRDRRERPARRAEEPHDHECIDGPDETATGKRLPSQSNPNIA